MTAKKDNIEELILSNLDRFEKKEPQEGHFERFEAKLAKQNKKKVFTLKNMGRVAAAAVFAFLIINQGLIYFSPKETEVSSLGDISTEYSEVEYYYTNAIESGISQWSDFHKTGILSDEDNVMMETELEEFDTMMTKLQEELKANPNDERVINAMLEHYQTKLNLINLIINNLQEVKTQNETKYEIEI